MRVVDSRALLCWFLRLFVVAVFLEAMTAQTAGQRREERRTPGRGPYVQRELEAHARSARNRALIGPELFASIVDGVVSRTNWRLVEIERRRCEQDGMVEGEATLRSLLRGIEAVYAVQPASVSMREDAQDRQRLSFGAAAESKSDGPLEPRSRMGLPIHTVLILLLLTATMVTVLVKLTEMNFSCIFTRLVRRHTTHVERGASPRSRTVVYRTLKPPGIRRLKRRAGVLTVILLLAVLAAVALVVGKTAALW